MQFNIHEAPSLPAPGNLPAGFMDLLA